MRRGLACSSRPWHPLTYRSCKRLTPSAQSFESRCLNRRCNPSTISMLRLRRWRESVSTVSWSTETATHSARLAELTLEHRLPTVFLVRDNVEAGGFMSYGPDLLDLTRRAATYIDKILKGAKPADLPVEQATKFELVVNNKTAKAIGLAIPESFLLRADEVIE